MRKGKTRKVTEMGRLVTRSQVQSVVNQIATQLAAAMAKVQAENDARFAELDRRLREIEDAHGIAATSLEPTTERTLALVGPQHIPEGGCEARAIPRDAVRALVDYVNGPASA